MGAPTRNGLVIPPYELGYTVPTDAQINQRGVVTNHHGYYPRRLYICSQIDRIFRNLTPNVYPMLGTEHNIGRDNYHSRFEPPKKPKDTLMIDVIEEHLATHGTIECVRENKTNEVYEIPLESWEMVKGLYRRVA